MRGIDRELTERSTLSLCYTRRTCLGTLPEMNAIHSLIVLDTRAHSRERIFGDAHESEALVIFLSEYGHISRFFTEMHTFCKLNGMLRFLNENTINNDNNIVYSELFEDNNKKVLQIVMAASRRSSCVSEYLLFFPS